jgi:hypothetical protein
LSNITAVLQYRTLVGFVVAGESSLSVHNGASRVVGGLAKMGNKCFTIHVGASRVVGRLVAKMIGGRQPQLYFKNG